MPTWTVHLNAPATTTVTVQADRITDSSGWVDFVRGSGDDAVVVHRYQEEHVAEIRLDNAHEASMGLGSP